MLRTPISTGSFKSGPVIAVCLLATLCRGSSASEVGRFGDLSLEELMNETVTSVSKREQKMSDVAAAVTVLSNEDIQRSGVTTVADALRLVPGMNVGSVNANQWAISARGFNNLYANKLLVLVDGRAVYSPMFAGVQWDAEQTILEDVDRIEIIRGPGATVWGANAVNGVVNVVTRTAKDTQGTLLYGAAGDVQRSGGGVRYGGRLGERTYYRVFANAAEHGDFRLADGSDADDSWRARHGGVRIDHHPDDDSQLTFQAAATAVRTDDDIAKADNANILGRFERRIGERSSVKVESYFDRAIDDELSRADFRTDTFDINAQHTFGLGERNDVIWGLGYRHVDVALTQTTPLLQVRNDSVNTQLFSAFVQNEFKLIPDRVAVTGGVKVEHNDYTGVEVQPSVRVVYKPAKNQTLWGAVSRAVRTPSGVEGKDVFSAVAGAPFVGPGGAVYVPRVLGNPGLSSEVLWAYELGYRVQPTDRVNIDTAIFHNHYSDVIALGSVSRFDPGVPAGTAEVPFANALSGHTYGGEISVTVSASASWRITTSYSLLLANIDGPPASGPESVERSAPRNQIVVRSSHDLSDRLSLDAQLRYVDAIQSVPSYLTADVRIAYRWNDALEIAVVGQNLLQDQHLEQGPAFFVPTTEVPRGVYGKLTWRF